MKGRIEDLEEELRNAKAQSREIQKR